MARLYALTYNLLFLLPEAVITAVCLGRCSKAYDAARPGTGGGRGLRGCGLKEGGVSCAIFLNGEYEAKASTCASSRRRRWSWRPTAATPFCAVTTSGRDS